LGPQGDCGEEAVLLAWMELRLSWTTTAAVCAAAASMGALFITTANVNSFALSCKSQAVWGSTLASRRECRYRTTITFAVAARVCRILDVAALTSFANCSF